MPHWSSSSHEARGQLNQKLRMDSNYGRYCNVITLLLDTATSACRTSECPQTIGVKRLTYESLLSEDIRMDTF